MFLLQSSMILLKATISVSPCATCEIIQIRVVRIAEIKLSVVFKPGWKLREAIKDFWTIPVTLWGLAPRIIVAPPALLQ
jgi:hypothetical protein